MIAEGTSAEGEEVSEVTLMVFSMGELDRPVTVFLTTSDETATGDEQLILTFYFIPFWLTILLALYKHWLCLCDKHQIQCLMLMQQRTCFLNNPSIRNSAIYSW